MRLVGPRKGRYIYAISAKHLALEYSIDKAVAMIRCLICVESTSSEQIVQLVPSEF